MKWNRKNERRFETLENRSMLAGNVTASVAAGNLTITGDNSANIITVTELANNQWQIIGAATKVNGKTQITTAPATGTVTINMNGGNDVLVVHDANVGGHLTILMGAGNDATTLFNI